MRRACRRSILALPYIWRLTGLSLKDDRKTGRLQVDIHEPVLLVGAHRVYEHDDVKKNLSKLGFIGEKTATQTRAPNAIGQKLAAIQQNEEEGPSCGLSDFWA